MNALSKIIDSQDCCPESPKETCYMDTIVGNLTRKQTRAKTDYDNATAALEALKKNPEVANLLELITKAGR